MKKMSLMFLPVFIILVASCGAPTARPSELPPSTSMWPTATLLPENQRATLTIGLDMGGGGAGFSATLYAQEVSTGKTFHTFLSAGMHGASTLPTSAPVILYVEAPGTYVFYARLTNAPDEYHYGATTCEGSQSCDTPILQALSVETGQNYHVTINDPAALLPEIDKPVSVPWTK